MVLLCPVKHNSYLCIDVVNFRGSFWDGFWDDSGSPSALPSGGSLPHAETQFLVPWGGQQEGHQQNRRSHSPDDPEGVGGYAIALLALEHPGLAKSK